LPTIQSLAKQVETVELDMEFANEEEKKELEAAKNRLNWKALRLAATKDMSLLNKATPKDIRGLLESDQEIIEHEEHPSTLPT
jgi:hypothetical protein